VIVGTLLSTVKEGRAVAVKRGIRTRGGAEIVEGENQKACRCTRSNLKENRVLRNRLKILEKFGSSGKIRTCNPSVNSRGDQKPKCRVWCRLHKIWSHSYFLDAPNPAPKVCYWQRISGSDPALY